MRYFVIILLVMIFAGSWLFTQDSEALMIIDNPVEGADVIVVGTNYEIKTVTKEELE